MTLEERFDAASRSNYETAKKLGYDAMGYIREVAKRGWLGAAKHFLTTENYQDGFARLLIMQRLDLSVEYLVVSEEFRPLFTDVEVSTANARLTAR